MSEHDTKYLDLNTNLSAIGKAVFVEFYYDFKDTSISDKVLANKIYTQNPLSKSVNQNFRIPRARHIFKEGQQLEALKIIVKSKRVSIEARELAKVILKQETYSEQKKLDEIEEHNFIQKLNLDIVYTLPNETQSLKYINEPEYICDGKKHNVLQYKRNRKIAENALRMAHYLCEVDNKHFVFRRKNGNMNYTEPHHLVPLSAGKDFPNINLDREQNIISLCSNCHNLLHYGADSEPILHNLYEQRKDLLAAIGIDISFGQLKKYYE